MMFNLGWLVGGGLAAWAATEWFTRAPDAVNPSHQNKFQPTMPTDTTSTDLTGSAFARSLPKGPGRERESLIMGAVGAGKAKIRWGFVVNRTKDGREFVLPVLSRVLAIGTSADALRVEVNYLTCQRIADLLDCHLCTPKVATMIFQQAVTKVDPQNHPSWVTDGTMANTNRMIEQSALLDSLIAPESTELVANEGKFWVITQRFFKPLGNPGMPSFDNWDKPAGTVGSKHNAANFGFFQRNGVPIQSVGLAHDMSHTDYSQYVTLMSQRCFVGDVEMATADVLKDPNLCDVLSDEGPLPMAIHPDLRVGA